MPQVTFITPNGDRIVVENASGTLAEAAVEHNVEGIDADCGGVCSCATCHVRVPLDWMGRLIPPTADERDLLSFHENVDERSRLSCQIEVTDAIDGLVVEVAKL